MKSRNSWMRSGLVLALGTVCVASAPNAWAQVKTTTSIQPGQSSKVVRVDRGEVLALEGNDLIVRMEDGSVRHFENIPESAKVTVDGKQLGIHDLKPGMKLQRTITTTTTPHTVTSILTVTGKVWHVTPPLSVILTLENGMNQSFKIPKDQKFDVNGEMVDAFGLKKGMVVRAIKIVEEAPMTTTAEQKRVTGTMPTPPPTLPADTPLLIAEGASTAAPLETSEAHPGATTKGAAASPATSEASSSPAPTEAPAAATTEVPAAPEKANPTGGYTALVGLGILGLIIVLVAAKFARRKSRA